MSGTVEGGKKAAKVNKKRYGRGFYKRIGAIGGKKSVGGGFTGDSERAKAAGAIGGKRRWEKYRQQMEEE